jgi:ABC-type multidrug transport system ATPase subunit
MTALLRIDGLSFSYPGRHVFTGWSAEVGAGLTWLRGGNGSGKSTLLALLAGALPPLLGSLSVMGVVQADQPLAYRRAVYWCGPAGIVFDHLRPPEYFGFIAGLYPRLDAAALAAHVEGLGLRPFLGQRLAALSTGTQRKVALATALAVGSTVVLLDEPFNALDAASSAYFRAALLRESGDPARAWLVASHEAPGAEPAAVIDLDQPASTTG